MATTIPDQCTLSFFKNQAQILKKDLESEIPEALERILLHHPRYVGKKKDALKNLQRSDYLLVIAREYGFPSWPKLKSHVETIESYTKAREIQVSMIPRELPSVPGLDMDAYLTSAWEVGGDFYDVIKLDEHRTVFLLLDINGKGLPGVVTMKRLRDTIRESMKSETSPSSALKKINQIAFIGLVNGLSHIHDAIEGRAGEFPGALPEDRKGLFNHLLNILQSFLTDEPGQRPVDVPEGLLMDG